MITTSYNLSIFGNCVENLSRFRIFLKKLSIQCNLSITATEGTGQKCPLSTGGRLERSQMGGNLEIVTVT